MRNKRLVLWLSSTAVLAIGLTVAIAQPGGGNRAPRGDRGGAGGRAMDPNRWFSMLSGGKDYLDQNDINTKLIPMSARMDPNAKENLDRYMQQQGITNGTLTRAQFAAYTTQRMAAANGGAAPATPGGSPVATTGNGPPPMDEQRIKESYKRRVENSKDGLLRLTDLTSDRDQALRDEFNKWDKNQNGIIEYDEYKEYFTARMQFRSEQNGGNDRRGQGGQFNGEEFQPPPEQVEEKRVVYRRDKDLPKNLPAWFKQVPRHNLGQIALYEWKNANRSVDEFRKYDRNADGFITVQEVLAEVLSDEKKSGTANRQGGQGEQAQEETLLVIAGPGAIDDDSPLPTLSPGEGSPDRSNGFQLGGNMRGNRGGQPNGNTNGFSRGNRGGQSNGNTNGNTRGNRGGQSNGNTNGNSRGNRGGFDRGQ